MIAKSLFRLAGVTALLSAVQLSAAPVQQCLTETDLHGMVAYMLPSITETAVKRCASQLPANAYLTTRGEGLVSQLRKGQSAAWPAARDALAKMAGKDDEATVMFKAMPEGVVGPMMESMLARQLGNEIKSQNCKDIDRVMASLAPLPAANLVDAVTAIAMVAGRNGKKFQTCEPA